MDIEPLTKRQERLEHLNDQKKKKKEFYVEKKFHLQIIGLS